MWSKCPVGSWAAGEVTGASYRDGDNLPTLLACDGELGDAVERALRGRVIRYRPQIASGSTEDVEARACADFVAVVERRRVAVVVLDCDTAIRCSTLRAGWDLLRRNVAVVGIGASTPERIRSAYDMGAAAVLDVSAWSAGDAAQVVADHASYARAWRAGRAERLTLEQACHPLRSPPRSRRSPLAAGAH